MRVEVITPTADPNQGGFGSRVHGLVWMFSQFAEVDVVLTNWFGGERVPGVRYHAFPLEDGLRTRLGRLGTYYRTRLPKRARTTRPDLVVVESLDLVGLVANDGDIPFILDEHNVYWNLLRYEIFNTPFLRGWLGRRPSIRSRLVPRLLERAQQFEMRTIRESQRTLVTSEVDRREILARCPDVAGKVRILPNCVDVRRTPVLPQTANSRTVVFVGDFNYGPNRQAAAFITETLTPGLRDAQFILVGSDPPPTARAPNVVATGHVSNLESILRDAAVCVAPLSNGSGTRIKILTYLAAARAVVATGKACEGIPVQDGIHLLIRDDPREFRDAVRQLLADPEQRRVLGTKGRELVQSSFDWGVHVPWLRDFSREVLSEANT